MQKLNNINVLETYKEGDLVFDSYIEFLVNIDTYPKFKNIGLLYKLAINLLYKHINNSRLWHMTII